MGEPGNRALPDPLEVESLQHLGLLAGAGLLVSLVVMTYGLDLSQRFSVPQTHNVPKLNKGRVANPGELGGFGLGFFVFCVDRRHQMPFDRKFSPLGFDFRIRRFKRSPLAYDSSRAVNFRLENSLGK